METQISLILRFNPSAQGILCRVAAMARKPNPEPATADDKILGQIPNLDSTPLGFAYSMATGNHYRLATYKDIGLGSGIPRFPITAIFL